MHVRACRVKQREINGYLKELGLDMVEQRITESLETPLRPSYQLVSRIIVRPLHINDAPH